MAVSRVDLLQGGQVVTAIDITDSTVTPASLMQGVVAYGADGSRLVGTATGASVDENVREVGGVSYPWGVVEGKYEGIRNYEGLYVGDSTATLDLPTWFDVPYDGMTCHILLGGVEYWGGGWANEATSTEFVWDGGGAATVTLGGKSATFAIADGELTVTMPAGETYLYAQQLSILGDSGYDGAASVWFYQNISVQDKTVAPTDSVQFVTADTGYDALNQVTVKPVQLQAKTVTPSAQAQVVTATDGWATIATRSGTGNRQTMTISTAWATFEDAEAYYGLPFTLTGNVTSWDGTKADSISISGTLTREYANYQVDGDVVSKVSQGSAGITISIQSGVGCSSYEYELSVYMDYHGLSQVTVNPIPSEYIVPTGTKSITANGTHDVTQYASVDVAVPSGTPTLQSKTVTPTTARQVVVADSGYDALSSVTVEPIPSNYGLITWDGSVLTVS